MFSLLKGCCILVSKEVAAVGLSLSENFSNHPQGHIPQVGRIYGY